MARDEATEPEATEPAEQEEVLPQRDDMLPPVSEADRVLHLIRQADPDYQPGETTQHLEFVTDPTGRTIRVDLAMNPAGVQQLRQLRRNRG